MSTEIKQACLCSLGLVEECPAHPYKTRKVKVKPSRQALREGECPACVFIRSTDHEAGRHYIYAPDVKTALECGQVFCIVPKLTNAPLVVRDVRRHEGVLQIQTLEGWHDSDRVTKIWMST